MSEIKKLVKSLKPKNDRDILSFITIPRTEQVNLYRLNPKVVPKLPEGFDDLPLSVIYSPFLRQSDNSIDLKALKGEQENNNNREKKKQERKQWLNFYNTHKSDYYWFAKCCPGIYDFFRRNCSCDPCCLGTSLFPMGPLYNHHVVVAVPAQIFHKMSNNT